MRLVRLLFVCLLLAPLPAAASEPLEAMTTLNDGTGSVEVVIAETVRYHPKGQSIRDLCRAGLEVVGCTDFPVERLECSCVRRGDHWVIEAKASIDAEVHLADRQSYSRILAHERMHLVDLEAALRAHLGGVTAQHFESQPGCDELAKVMSSPSYVRAVMNRLRLASNEKYHCRRPGSPIEAPAEPLMLARARRP